MLRSDRSLFRRRSALPITPATSWSCSNVSAGQCRSRRTIIRARNPSACPPGVQRGGDQRLHAGLLQGSPVRLGGGRQVRQPAQSHHPSLPHVAGQARQLARLVDVRERRPGSGIASVGRVKPIGVFGELDQCHPVHLEMAPETGHPAAHRLVDPLGRHGAQLGRELSQEALEAEPLLRRGPRPGPSAQGQPKATMATAWRRMTHPATLASSSNGATRQHCHVGPNKSNLRRDAPAGLVPRIGLRAWNRGRYGFRCVCLFKSARSRGSATYTLV